MWNVPTHLMCRQHLLGEHVEIHMFIGVIKRDLSVEGYLRNGLLDPSMLYLRHDEIVHEMDIRGYNHQSPLELILIPRDLLRAEVFVDVDKNLADLYKRCESCRGLQNEARE